VNDPWQTRIPCWLDVPFIISHDQSGLRPTRSLWWQYPILDMCIPTRGTLWHICCYIPRDSIVDCSAAFAANTALLGQDKEAGTTGIQSLHRRGLWSATSKSNVHKINPEWQIPVSLTLQEERNTIPQPEHQPVGTQKHACQWLIAIDSFCVCVHEALFQWICLAKKHFLSVF